MKLSQKGIELIKSFEGFSSKPYLCTSGIPTIGFGSTRYPSGSRVSLNDPEITQEKAIGMLMYDVLHFERDVNSLLKLAVTQYQFDALVSFAYNVGSDIDQDSIAEGLGDSTLLKKVNNSPLDPTIRNEFMKWINSKGKPSNGLINRRKKEADLYFSVWK